jgi:hypothetical protein
MFYPNNATLSRTAHEGELTLAPKSSVMVTKSTFGPAVFPGIDFIKLHLDHKTFQINWRRQILNKFPP